MSKKGYTIADFGLRIAKWGKGARPRASGVGPLPEAGSLQSEAFFARTSHQPPVTLHSLALVLLLSFPVVSFADYVGLEVIDRSDLTICKDQTEPEIPFKLDVCEIHVVFDDPADRLISVGFCDTSTTDPAGFYQHTLGGDTAPGCTLVGAFPTVACDSFVTLGEECAVGGSSTDPDFDSTGFNSSGEVSGGWFNSAPLNSQGAPDANGRVMIGRFSYKQNKNTSGDVCVFTKLAGSEEVTEFLLQPFDCSNPGPQGAGGPTIWFVDDSGAPTNGCCTKAADCIDWTDACPGLQAPLGLAIAGDQIWVAKATDPYLPDGGTGDRTKTFQLKTGVAIYGGFLGNEDPARFDLDDRDFVANETILSGDLNGDDEFEACMEDSECAAPPPNNSRCVEGFCTRASMNDENSYHVVTGSTTDSTAVLDGLTITAGNANVPPADPDNRDKGGGMLNFGGSPTVTNCTFRGNKSSHDGGGMVNFDFSEPTVTNCTFSDNWGSFAGAGMTNKDSSPTVTNCTFIGNSASVGGGMDNHEGAHPTLTNCTFIGNTAIVSGALQFGHITACPTLINCIFSGNSAERGGAINFAADECTLTMTNCIFTGNFTIPSVEFPENEDGGAIRHRQGVLIANNCTFAGNSTLDNGGGIYVGAGVLPGNTTLSNCIFWDNSDSGPQDESSQIHVDGPVPIVSHSDIQGLDTFAGNGNIGLDPMFIDAVGPDMMVGTEDDNLRLMPGSPVIDAANNNAVTVCSADLDGNERFVDDPVTEDCQFVEDPDACGDFPIADMGAYEFGSTAVLDCDGHGVPDDCCPADVDGDGAVGPFDLATLLATWGNCDPCIPGLPDCACRADFDNDCSVGALDLPTLLASWGPCP